MGASIASGTWALLAGGLGRETVCEHLAYQDIVAGAVQMFGEVQSTLVGLRGSCDGKRKLYGAQRMRWNKLGKKATTKALRIKNVVRGDIAVDWRSGIESMNGGWALRVDVSPRLAHVSEDIGMSRGGPIAQADI